MEDFIFWFNLALFWLFLLFYSYQFYYLYIGLKDKRNPIPIHKPSALHKMGIIICARNESQVIGNLLDSINHQNYPKELLKTIVVADNCDDHTAAIAREKGAIVYERFNKEKVGKGYALKLAFENIFAAKEEPQDAYIVIDADNLLDVNYVYEMNRIFDQGYVASTSYRNCKNYGQNWITSGYGLWFLREAEYLNRPRMKLGTSCAISGTGFFIATDLLRSRDGWHFHLLTEDIECTIATVLEGHRIGYAAGAMLYDEQPFTFSDSWRQRKRWAKGFYQVLGNYGKQMAKTLFSKGLNFQQRFSNYDMIMTIMPALFITLFSVVLNIGFFVYAKTAAPNVIEASLSKSTSMSILMSATLFYSTLFFVGCVTMCTEHKNIQAKRWQKVISLFSFPFFMFTYIPIAVVALFMKVKWEPIHHTVAMSIDEFNQTDKHKC